MPFRLYVGFQGRDFPETSYLALFTHALKLCKFGCDRSIKKSTLLGKHLPSWQYLAFSGRNASAN